MSEVNKKATPRDAFWLIGNTSDEGGNVPMVRLDGQDLTPIGWFVRRVDAERVQKCVHACGEFEDPERSIDAMKSALQEVEVRTENAAFRIRLAGRMMGLAVTVTALNILVYLI